LLMLKMVILLERERERRLWTQTCFRER
jgi:hypothetical protein